MTGRSRRDRVSNVGDISSLARGGTLNVLGSATLAVLNFVLLLILARGLGASDVGLFLTAIAIFNLLAIVATAGVDTGFIRTISQWRSLGRRPPMQLILSIGLVPVLIVGSLIALVTFLGAETAAGWFEEGDSSLMGFYLATLAPFIPVAGLYLSVLGATRGYETMVPTNLVDRMAKIALQVLLVGLAVAAGASTFGLALSWAFPFLIGLAASSYWLFKLERRSPPTTRSSGRAEAPFEMIRDFWSFTLPRSFASVFRVAMQWLDVILVGALMSPSDAAIYVVATRLLQFGIVVANAIGQAAQPMFSSLLTAGHDERTRALYKTATAWVVTLVWPQYLAIAIFAPALLGVFGTEFSEGAATAAILAGGALLASGLGPVDMLLLMAGKSTWSLWNTIASLSVNLTLLVLLIPRFGLAGAALAWAAGRIVGNMLPFVEVARHLRMHPFGVGWLRAAFSAVIAFGVIGLAMRAAFGASLTVAIVYGLTAVGAYLVLLHRYRRHLDLGAALHVLRPRRRTAVVAAPKGR